jgi:TPR repeat protein
VRWYQKAAAQNDEVAQYNLGIAYENGEGVAEDDEQAVKWYRKAADQRYAHAYYNLGHMYKDGEGVAADPVQADKWFLLAAKDGDGQAIEAHKTLTASMTPAQIAEASRLAKEW